MGKSLVERVTDDLTGEEIDPNTPLTRFTFNGTRFSLYLGPESLERMETALKPFTAVAESKQVQQRSGPKAKVRNQKVRAWGESPDGARRIKEAGLTLGARGRIAQEVFDLYDSVNK